VPFPFTDFTAAKQRPAVVVSPDRLNRQRDDVVVMAITSQVPVPIAEDEILLSSTDLAGNRIGQAINHQAGQDRDHSSGFGPTPTRHIGSALVGAIVNKYATVVRSMS
jgi:hypothetical protein